jgi:hypothetical protein
VGAIRIPLHASSLFFNDASILAIPRKSFKFLTLLFSIPTAPTKLPLIQTSRALESLPIRMFVSICHCVHDTCTWSRLGVSGFVR